MPELWYEPDPGNEHWVRLRWVNVWRIIQFALFLFLMFFPFINHYWLHWFR